MSQMKDVVYRLLDGKRINNWLIEIVEVERGIAYGAVIDTAGQHESVVFNFTTSEEQLANPDFMPKILAAFETAIAEGRTQLLGLSFPEVAG
jgi:hypothetical protein